MSGHCCDQMLNALSECKDNVIVYCAKFREYGIPINDGGTSYLLINYCPWCGNKLPLSLRDKWFDIVFDELKLEGPDDPNLPAYLNSDEWWKCRNDLNE